MKIGERGQLTIPKNLREKYGLLPNIEVELVPEDFGVVIKKKTHHSNPVQKVYGILKKNTSTDDLIKAMRGQ
ncbi:AbrB/MazE/SpoVT family DNA-binding domain-containing protein [bacterium]|nr:AbrB/MazE/SpoVT family DNA-binding domain-containing protein [bacterium]